MGYFLIPLGIAAIGFFVWFACAVLAGQSFDHEDRRAGDE